MCFEEAEPRPSQTTMLRALSRAAGYVLGAFLTPSEGEFDIIAAKLAQTIAAYARFTRRECEEADAEKRAPRAH